MFQGVDPLTGLRKQMMLVPEQEGNKQKRGCGAVGGVCGNAGEERRVKQKQPPQVVFNVCRLFQMNISVYLTDKDIEIWRQAYPKADYAQIILKRFDLLCSRQQYFWSELEKRFAGFDSVRQIEKFSSLCYRMISSSTNEKMRERNIKICARIAKTIYNLQSIFPTPTFLQSLPQLSLLWDVCLGQIIKLFKKTRMKKSQLEEIESEWKEVLMSAVELEKSTVELEKKYLCSTTANADCWVMTARTGKTIRTWIQNEFSAKRGKPGLLGGVISGFKSILEQIPLVEENLSTRCSHFSKSNKIATSELLNSFQEDFFIDRIPTKAVKEFVSPDAVHKAIANRFESATICLVSAVDKAHDWEKAVQDTNKNGRLTPRAIMHLVKLASKYPTSNLVGWDASLAHIIWFLDMDQNSRREALKGTLEQHGCSLRSDSTLCSGFIRGTIGCHLGEVVGIMRIAQFLFKHGHRVWSTNKICFEESFKRASYNFEGESINAWTQICTDVISSTPVKPALRPSRPWWFCDCGARYDCYECQGF